MKQLSAGPAVALRVLIDIVTNDYIQQAVAACCSDVGDTVPLA
jgi:hypothetical protein